MPGILQTKCELHVHKSIVMSQLEYFCIFVHKNITCHVKYTQNIHHLYPMGCTKLCVDMTPLQTDHYFIAVCVTTYRVFKLCCYEHDCESELA